VVVGNYRVFQRYTREKATESKMRNQSKKLCCDVFHATCKNDKTLNPAHVFPSEGSRRLRPPRLANFDFDAVDGAVNHLL
jgi:hypothetical protein